MFSHKSITLMSCLCVVCALLYLALAGHAKDASSLRGYVPRLEKNLKENIIPFWMSKSLDRQNGGYIINFGPRSEPKGPGTKMIVTQARQVWLFSRLVHEGYGKEYLDAAQQGYRFLLAKTRDQT